MNTGKQEVISKVPEVIWLFWIIKILATTLGETGGDALSMSLNLGYLVSTGIFAILFLLAVSIQIRAKISSGYFHYCHHHRRHNAPFVLDFFLAVSGNGKPAAKFLSTRWKIERPAPACYKQSDLGILIRQFFCLTNCSIAKWKK